ncbi:HAD-IA family hydrolase [Streptomyces sp. NPDC020096]
MFERDGALELIDAAVYSSEVPWAKPHPRIFTRMTSAMGIADPAACALVGDRLFEDIYGAQEAGMPTIWVPHSVIPEDELGSGTAEPDATVVSLEELPRVIDAWNAGR